MRYALSGGSFFAVFRRFLFVRLASLGLFSVLVFSLPSHAADFPSKPLRFVVCTPAGGQIDLLGRLTAEKAAAALGQPVVVDNKPGAAGRIAVQDLFKAPADGHGVLFCGINLITMRLFFKEPGYEMGKDLLPIAILMDNAGTIGINAAIPARNLREFIAYVKANPGKVNYVSYGNHPITLAIESFMQAEGFAMTPIPYAGTAPIVAALIQGDVHFALNAASVFKPLVDRNQVRLIATIGSQRTQSAPDLQTATEQGYANFIAPSWYGGFVRGGTPRDIVERLNRELNAAVRQPDVRAKLDALDAVVLNLSLDEVRKDVQAKDDFFAKVAERLKIQKQ